MLHRGNLKYGLALVGALLLGAIQTDDAVGQAGCRPPTPSPCAADGVCRPKRDTWGHFHTRWRQWPGEPAAKGPTPAEALPEEAEEKLPSFQRPRPNQEDLRGPAKPPKAATDGEDASGEPAVPMEPGIDPAPGLDDGLPGLDDGLPALDDGLPALDDGLPALDDGLLDFDPQGDLMPPPSKDDAPPALPPILRELSRTRPNAFPVQPLSDAGNQPVVRANATRRSMVSLINPAADVDQADNQTRQAIYFEATDLDQQ